MNSRMHADMTQALAELRAPQPALPAGAWDVHAHIFGPFDRFPLIEGTPYRPPLAPYDDYIRMLDTVGFAHGVVVHAGANGFDNSGMLDGLERAGGRLRGIAVVPIDTADAELERMNGLGVRGVRFTAVARMAAATSGVLGLAALADFAPRLQALGWHAQIWAQSALIAENEAMLRALGIPIVFDHMGNFPAENGTGDPGFQTMLRMARDGVAWVKTTAFRNAPGFPEMDEIRPFHEALVTAAPDRLLWGSDWPFIGMGDRLPSPPHLIGVLRDWTGDAALVDRILVDNPQRLYA